LATVAAQLQRGEWRQLNAPGWTRDLLYTDCNGGGGSTAHTDWSDELFWDQRTQTARFLGAGHLRAFGFVFFSANSNTWCRDDVGLHACLRSTGYSRCFTHAYDHQAFDPGRSQLMLLTAGQEILRYDVATRGWSFDAPPTPIGGGYGQVLEFFPARDALFHAVASTGVFISRTNVVTPLPSMPGVGPYHNTATSLPHHRALLYGGGNNSKRLYLVREDAGVTQVPDLTFPSGVTDQIHTAYTTLTYDPIDGDALLLSEEGTFHALELPSLTWRRLPDPPWRGRSGYSHALATPVDDHQVVLFAFPQGAYSVWLYKP
jgi:hypothetical protein